MKSLKSFLFVIILSFTTVLYAQRSTREYVGEYKCLADSLEEVYDIPSEVILGVAIHESGAGTSKLAKQFYNHFGIKGSNQNAIKKLGHRSSYKEYQSIADSYVHFCEIVSRKKFYSQLKGDSDYKVWVASLRKSGYATAKDWEPKVLRTIDRFYAYFNDPLNFSQPQDSVAVSEAR